MRYMWFCMSRNDIYEISRGLSLFTHRTQHPLPIPLNRLSRIIIIIIIPFPYGINNNKTAHPPSPQRNISRATILTDIRQHGFRVPGLGAHFPGRDGEMVVSASTSTSTRGRIVVGFGFVGRDATFLVADVHFVGDEAEGAEDEDWSLN